MTPKHDITRYADLHERVQPFAEIARQLVLDLGLEKSGGRGPVGEPASERVIRDYVRRRVLSPTERSQDGLDRGYYGYRHLLEFLAARVLLNDGWPLEKIAERHRHSSDAELLALIPGQADDNPALSLARSFLRPGDAPRRPEVSARRLAPPPILSQAEPRNAASADPSALAARRRAELPLLMRMIAGSETSPRPRRLLSLELGDDITLQIDEARADRLTVVEAEQIGRAVTAALIALPALTRGKDPK